MKFWFDEDLSPTLVQVANEQGYEATCNRDRGMLVATDPQLRRLVQSEGHVFVTDNASDFRPMCVRDAIHPGLIVIPGVVGRDRQRQLARMLLDWIVNAAATAREDPGDFMINTLVRIDEAGNCTRQDLASV